MDVSLASVTSVLLVLFKLQQRTCTEAVLIFVSSLCVCRCVQVWDTTTWDETHSMAGQQCFAFAPNSAMIACGSSEEDGLIRVLETRTWQQIGALEGHEDSVWCLAFSHAGQYLVSALSARASSQSCTDACNLWKTVNDACRWMRGLSGWYCRIGIPYTAGVGL